MTLRLAVSSEHVHTIPIRLRSLIGKHFAGSRWEESCQFYDAMPERYRSTVCFHAGLKKHHPLLRLSELDDSERERVINALDELRSHFAKYRKHAISNAAYVQRLPISVRKTLFLHAGLTQSEFNQPVWRIEDETCIWRDKVLKAIRELLNIFADVPDILTSVKPETYFN